MQLSSVFAGLVIALTATVYAAPIEADSAKREEHGRIAYYVAEKRAPVEHEKRGVETAHDPGTGYHIADKRAPSYEKRVA
ncbi:hypothetical protein FIBSPDRAFT_965329 [Athelia psychrophila]|uniref:Uncharacterized protein n=1 Tax=Athelia psychrophila TaxID=1759441 RepID=A0A167W3I9_9AGAM|nr:hypothetical protein FIBSPDRAFT_967103 [Fibularhizoctonia sp. CBS 109695]KZP07832.1 hypothetical protein FIBSPDRAFT_965329 [Fibularhizoctonia sp. CBS 109695]